ncbi:MAG: glycosyltransferase family 4 protein [Nocardioidaceae bacterium]
MRIGLVCPYSLDVPGGVQNHVKDLAEALIGLGHHVSVLAPSEDDGDGLPPYVVPAGRAVPVPANGSVARLTFGPVSNARTRRWLREGDFDVLHIHEPAAPSLSLLSLWAADGPVVATYHRSSDRSRTMAAGLAILRPSMEKVTARIAVSEYARDTLVHHVGGEPVIIPNGVYVDRFRGATPRPEWRGEGGTVAFIGRLDEPRKGLDILLDALPAIARQRPGVRLLVVGRGDVVRARSRIREDLRENVLFLGPVDDREKAQVLRTADVYVAPNTGGESFGIILVEAMAAGACVVASDLPAFDRVLEGGRCGLLFDVGDSTALGEEVCALLADQKRREELREAAGAAVDQYDWANVARRVLQVYETVIGERRVGVQP